MKNLLTVVNRLYNKDNPFFNLYCGGNLQNKKKNSFIGHTHTSKKKKNNSKGKTNITLISRADTEPL